MARLMGGEKYSHGIGLMNPVNSSFKQYWRLLLAYLRPQKGTAMLLTGLLLGSVGLQLANPQIVRYFLDTAEAGDALGRLLGAAALFTGVALVRQAIHVAAMYVGENVAWTATNLLRATWRFTASSWT